MRGKIFIWRKSKLELPCHLPSLMINFSCKQRVFIALNPGICSIAYAIYMWEMCIHIGMRYLCTTHIIDAYSSTNKENASSSMHIYIYMYTSDSDILNIYTLGVLIQHMAMAYVRSMLPYVAYITRSS